MKRKTNAENQQAFRERMKARGFSQRLYWTDPWGIIASAGREGRGGDLGPQLTERQMTGRLRAALDGLDEAAAAQIRAGIADYADIIRRIHDRADARIQPPLFSNTEAGESPKTARRGAGPAKGYKTTSKAQRTL